jgi:hypothetical protein
LESVEFELVPILGTKAKAAAAEMGKTILASTGAASGGGKGGGGAAGAALMAAAPEVGIPAQMAGGGGGGVSFSDALTAVTGGLATIGASFMAASETIKGFVQYANPASAERFNMALEDLYGVIGQSLEPVLEVATQVLRAFGDFIASILPSADEMQKLMKELQPVIDEFRGQLSDLVPVIKLVATVVMKLAQVVIQVAAWFANLIGATIGALGGSGAKLKSSVGAAYRGAHNVGIEDLGKQLRLSAFGGGSAMQQVADNTAEIAENTRGLKDSDFAGAGGDFGPNG